MSRAREDASRQEAPSPNVVTAKGTTRLRKHPIGTQRTLGPNFAATDPLEMTVSPADRLRWALIEQGHDPRLFDVADDFIRPGTVVVRAPLGAATPGLRAVWWDVSADRAVGVVAGTAEDMLEAAAVLKALTAAGPGLLPRTPPEDPLEPWTVIVATAHRLGLAVRTRPMNSSSRSMSVLFALRDWLESDEAAGVELKTSDTAVLMVLALHMSRDGQRGFPGTDKIARGVRLSPRTVETCLHRLRVADLIVSLVLHPRLGEAQEWRISDAFRAVLMSGSGATRQRAPHTAGAYAETTQEQRASAYPKQKDKANSSRDPKREDYPDLWREAVEDAERKKRNGMDIRSVPAYANPRYRELVAERRHQETERAATDLAQSALAGCSDCDRDGLRWWKPDGTPATRATPGALSERCDHAGNVVSLAAAAR